MSKVFSVFTKAVGVIGGLVPVLIGLASIHGQTPAQQQDTIVTAATAILDEIETIDGHSFAGDADVQATARDVVDAIQRLHAIVVAKAKAAAAPATA